MLFNLESKEVEKIFYSKNNLQIEALDWFDENLIILGKFIFREIKEENVFF